MANLNLSEFTEKLFVADADHTFIWDTAASISKRVSRNSWLDSGTLTSSSPVTISQTWNNAAVAFTGLKVDATSTNSAASSKLLDLQLGTVSKFSVDKSGIIALPQTGGDAAALICGGTAITNAAAYIGIYGIRLDSTSALQWSSGKNLNTLDTILVRDSASGNTLALRNGAAAQTFNVYGTYTSGSVYERMFMRYNGTALAFQVGTEHLGATARPLQFSISGSRRLIFEATGVNDTQIYAAGNTARNILTLRSSDESGRYQFYINAAGKSELYVGTGVLISEAGSSYFNGGNVGIGTTSPTSKLHVAGSSSPTITVENTLATGASQLLFKNTVVTGDTDGIFLNGSTQTGFGGAGSLNIKATTGPLAFHTASVTNALSIAQNGAATFSGGVTGFNIIATNYIGVPAGNGFSPNLGGSLDYLKFSSNGGSELARVGYFGTTATSYLSFGGVASTSPAFKRSTTTIQARLANDSAFTNIQGKLTTDTDYTATVVTPTGFLTLYDAQGTAYRVPCVAAP